MSADNDASGTFALLLSLGIKCVNNLNYRIENASTLNVPVLVLYRQSVTLLPVSLTAFKQVQQSFYKSGQTLRVPGG
jgi:spore maturation protein SpmA